MTHVGRAVEAVAGALACALLAASCTPPPTPFASVEVRVRESLRFDGDTPLPSRRSTQFSTIFTQFDDDAAKAVSFDPADPGKLPPRELGDAEHVLQLALETIVTRADRQEVTAFGRADPLTIRAISDLGEGQTSVDLKANLILSAPFIPEVLDRNLPAARTGTAACNDSAGHAWVVGGAANAYAFELEALTMSHAFDLDAAGQVVACDGDEHGALLVYEPAGPTMLIDADTVSGPTAVSLDGRGAATAATLHVVGDSAWFADADRAGIMRLSTKHVATASIPAVEPGALGAFVALSESVAVRFRNAGTDILSVNAAGTLDVSVAGAVDVAAVDPNGPRAVVRARCLDQNQAEVPCLLIGTVTVQGTDVVVSDQRQVDLGDLVPDEIQVLPSGRVVGLEHGANAVRVVVEGAGPANVLREHIAQTIGGAVLLLGGAAGHDVIVDGPG